MSAEPTLYRYVPVWRREEAGLSLYRVIEALGLGFVVQSRDFILPDDPQESFFQLERQFLELMSEEAPESRGGLEPTVRDAISRFDAEFQRGA